MLKIIGISMLVTVFGGIFILLFRDGGLWRALLTFGAVIVLVAWIYVAVYLITVKI
jgi:hypothetical protein